MTNETAKRKIEMLDSYLQRKADYGESDHEAMMMAVKALEQQPCEDAVSRKKIEKLKRWRFSYGTNTTIPQSDLFVKLADIRALPSVQPKYNTSEWCHDCKEYDQEKHYCPRFNKVIRNTVEEMKQPKTGHWEHGKEICKEYRGKRLVNITYLDWHCSNCHCVIEQSIKPKWRYCPNCGTRMIEPQESEDKE